MKILIAEDNKELRMMLVEYTRMAFPNADIWTAKDGSEAWAKFKGWVGADLVITDYDMPNMKGDELAERVKVKNSQYTRKHLPTILVSSAPERCKNRSMFTYVCDKGRMMDFVKVLKSIKSCWEAEAEL